MSDLSRPVALLALVAGVGYYIVLFATAESRVRRTCDHIEPGMTIAALAQYLEVNELGPQVPRPDGVGYVGEVKTFGRFGCRIEMLGAAVRRSTFDESN
jgi:hypothetical protein